MIDITDDSLFASKVRHIIKVMNKCNGEKIRAARILGITPNTFRRWLNDYETMGVDFSGMKNYDARGSAL